jgi:hypothetical protein
MLICAQNRMQVQTMEERICLTNVGFKDTTPTLSKALSRLLTGTEIRQVNSSSMR